MHTGWLESPDPGRRPVRAAHGGRATASPLRAPLPPGVGRRDAVAVPPGAARRAAARLAVTARIVLLGATGYTGRLTGEALVRRGHPPVLAGRSPEQAERLAERAGRRPRGRRGRRGPARFAPGPRRRRATCSYRPSGRSPGGATRRAGPRYTDARTTSTATASRLSPVGSSTTTGRPPPEPGSRCSRRSAGSACSATSRPRSRSARRADRGPRRHRLLLDRRPRVQRRHPSVVRGRMARPSFAFRDGRSSRSAVASATARCRSRAAPGRRSPWGLGALRPPAHFRAVAGGQRLPRLARWATRASRPPAERAVARPASPRSNYRPVRASSTPRPAAT